MKRRAGESRTKTLVLSKGSVTTRPVVGYAAAKQIKPPKARKRIKKRRVTKGGRGSDPAKIAWLHTLGCAVCGRMPVEVHHDRHLGSRATDKRTIALCPSHHMTGPQGVGQLGRQRFQEVHDFNMDACCAWYEANKPT